MVRNERIFLLTRRMQSHYPYQWEKSAFGITYIFPITEEARIRQGFRRDHCIPQWRRKKISPLHLGLASHSSNSSLLKFFL